MCWTEAALLLEKFAFLSNNQPTAHHFFASQECGQKHANPDMHARMHASRWLHKQGTQHATGTKDVVEICFTFSDPLEAKGWWETCGFWEKDPAQIKTEIWQKLSALRPLQHTALSEMRFYARLSDTIEKTFFPPTTKGVCMYEIETSGSIVFNFHRGEGASHTFSGLLILPQRSRQFIATPFPPFGNYTAGYIHVILPQRPLG